MSTCFLSHSVISYFACKSGVATTFRDFLNSCADFAFGAAKAMLLTAMKKTGDAVAFTLPQTSADMVFNLVTTMAQCEKFVTLPINSESEGSALKEALEYCGALLTTLPQHMAKVQASTGATDLTEVHAFWKHTKIPQRLSGIVGEEVSSMSR